MNDNQIGMNSTNNQMNSNNFNQNGDYNQSQQQNQNIQPQFQNVNNSNQQSLPSNTHKNNSTIFIIGAIVIVIIIGAILLFSGIFSGNDKNASIFVHDAKSIINGASSLVDSDNMSSLLGSTNNKYAPICSANKENESIIVLSEIVNKGYFSNDNNINYDLNYSFVKVKAVIKNNSCNYEYYIYLTDGTYSIGTTTNPVFENDITIKSVKK